MPSAGRRGPASSILDAVRHRDTMSPEGPGPRQEDGQRSNAPQDASTKPAARLPCQYGRQSCSTNERLFRLVAEVAWSRCRQSAFRSSGRSPLARAWQSCRCSELQPGAADLPPVRRRSIKAKIHGGASQPFRKLRRRGGGTLVGSQASRRKAPAFWPLCPSRAYFLALAQDEDNPVVRHVETCQICVGPSVKSCRNSATARPRRLACHESFRVFRRLQLLSWAEHDDQDAEQVFP